MKLKQKLIELDACAPSIEWSGDMTIGEAWDKCDRGDWMLWYYATVYPENIRELTLAKGHCANTVRHLMKDQRSIDAVDAAIAFGEGKISREEFIEKCADADAYAAVSYASYAATVSSAYADLFAADEADAIYAKRKNQQQTADICRKYLKLD